MKKKGVETRSSKLHRTRLECWTSGKRTGTRGESAGGNRNEDYGRPSKGRRVARENHPTGAALLHQPDGPARPPDRPHEFLPVSRLAGGRGIFRPGAYGHR